MDTTAVTGGADDIAVIGMSGRFPGAGSIHEFWHNVSRGIDSIARFTDQELLAAGVEPTLLTDPAFVKAGGVLDQVEMFDSEFFGFTSREAASIDPQQRIFLECAWESLEHAGYDAATYPGLVGVYAGAAMSSYLANIYGNTEFVEMIGEYQIGLGNDKDNMPTLVSYKLNLRGPSIAVQTACSTSLVAVAVACQNLLSYHCDMALAGGVRIGLPQTDGYLYQDGGILSPDGRCRTFDARAQGTVGGNGVGIVVLKRLQDALADGDVVHAVIKGSAVNNDGALKVGYTAPSVQGQAQVIAMAHAAGGIDPRTITFVEAHGTATDLGDPIEVAALTEAFRLGTQEKGFCALASVKANVGHLDTAAGVAGLIRTVLALEHRQIPPAVHFEEPNPEIDFGDSPFFVNTQLADWKTDGSPRRAGVSSFGIGGTNAHVVVEEAPEVQQRPSHRPVELLLLSARTAPALEAMTRNLAGHLQQHADTSLADVAYTLQAGRRAFPLRRAIVCRDMPDAIRALGSPDAASVRTGRASEEPRPVVFMFSGQGPQQVLMGHRLYQYEPTFRAEVDRCADLATRHLGLDLRAVLYPSPGDVDDARLQLDQTAVAPVALFSVQYALARLWMEWGVQPRAMIGHSLGEYVAACLAGVFSLEDALAIVATRAKLMQDLPPGAMLAVPLSERDTRALLSEGVSIAAVNAPLLTVVSGPLDAMADLDRQLSARGLETRRLSHRQAFHSTMVEPMLEALGSRVALADRHAPTIPFVSGVTGNWITAEEATDPGYWMRHARETVRFADGLDLLGAEDQILLEVGPGQTLTALAGRLAARPGGVEVLASLPGSRDELDEESHLLGVLGKLWISGTPIDWAGVHRHARRARTVLPTYPFARRRCWVDAPATAVATEALQIGPAKRLDMADWFYVPSWKRTAPANALERSSAPAVRWIVFSDTCGVGPALADAATTQGAHVVVVTAGASYAKHDDHAYCINPRGRGDYEALLRDVQGTQGAPDTIVHLWNVTLDRDLGDELDRFDDVQALGFESLLLLGQAIVEVHEHAPIQLIVGTTHLQDVNGSETLCASKATMLGPCRSIPAEYPNITCRCIDVTPPASESDGGAVIAASLQAEIAANVSDSIVAIRGPHRWVQHFDAVRLNKSDGPAKLRERGVYLVTGGMGGIGLTLAEHLARTCRARLVLVGRSDFADRATWADWLDTHGDDEPTSRRIRQLIRIEEAGGEVIVETADVTDVEAMRGVLERATTRFGPLNGVIHSAGVAGGRLMQFHTPAEASHVIAPKARGALVLDGLLVHDTLDFFLVCSSLTALLGVVGQADYCGANAFLDAFATKAARRGGRHVVSVNWDTWREVGMALNTVLPRDWEAHRAESLAMGIDSVEGVEATMGILQSGLAQVVVSTTDFRAAIAAQAGGAPDADARADDETPADVDEDLLARPDLATEYVEPRDEAEREIAQMWQSLFSIEQVGVHDNFFELGGHSLLALQFISRLRDTFHVELRARDLFDAPTVSGLAGIIAQRSPHARLEKERLAQTLALVEELSEEEILKLLSEQDRDSRAERL